MSGIIFEYVAMNISGGKRFLERQRKNRLQSSGRVNKCNLKRRFGSRFSVFTDMPVNNKFWNILYSFFFSHIFWRCCQYDKEQFSIQLFLVTTNHFEVKCFLSEFCGQFSQMHANLCTVIKILWASVGKKSFFGKLIQYPLKWGIALYTIVNTWWENK